MRKADVQLFAQSWPLLIPMLKELLRDTRTHCQYSMCVRRCTFTEPDSLAVSMNTKHRAVVVTVLCALFLSLASVKFVYAVMVISGLDMVSTWHPIHQNPVIIAPSQIIIWNIMLCCCAKLLREINTFSDVV